MGIRTREVLAGLGYLVVVAALIALSIMVYNKDFSSTTDISLHTDNIGSELQKGSDVKVRGVIVGRVSGVSTNGDGAVIKLALDPHQAKQIPANTTAQLLPKTLFGERYVSLLLPAAPTGSLHSGAQIQQDTSAQTVELQQVFQHLLPVLQAIQPDKLAILLSQLSQGLQGRGTELGNTFSDLAGFLTKFAPKVPQLTSDLQSLSSVAGTYQTAVPSLLSALNDFSVTAQTIYSQRQDLANLFATATTAADNLNGFVESNSGNIIGLSRDSLPSLQVVARYSGEFPCLTQALAKFAPISDQAFGHGSKQAGAHVTLTVVPSLGKYVAGKDTPTFTDDSGPQCPFIPGGSAISNTAPGAALPNAATTPAAADGLGSANSTQENQLIAELVAPSVGMSPAAFPRWGSLLLGPALRGTTVTVK